MSDFKMQIYRDGVPILEYHSLAFVLMYRDKKDMEWFESLPEDSQLVFRIERYQSDYWEDDDSAVTWGEQPKQSVIERYLGTNYRAVKPDITVVSSLDGLMGKLKEEGRPESE